MKHIKIVVGLPNKPIECDIKAEDLTDAIWLAGMVIYNLRSKLRVRPQVTEISQKDE